MEQDDMEHLFQIPTKQKAQKSTKKHFSGFLKNPNLWFYHLFVWNRNSNPGAPRNSSEKLGARWIFVISLHLFQIS
jgi:hypothetical protein